jgi:hypothetical protein
MRECALGSIHNMISTENFASPRFFFVLQWSEPEVENDDPHGTPLPNDAAAKAYAHRIVHELKEAGGYDDPDLKMVDKNSAGDVIHSISF